MSEHIVSPKIYILIFAALMILTFTTVYAATVDLNQYYAGLNVIVALVIATCKAILVILFSFRRCVAVVYFKGSWLNSSRINIHQREDMP